jgi:hypothetical protein
LRIYNNSNKFDGEFGHKENAYYTDKRYGRNDGLRRDNRGKLKNSYRDSYGSRRYNENGKTNDKKCFVCGKTGCWSIKHTSEKRRNFYQRFRSYPQTYDDVNDDYAFFLAKFEGIDISDDDADRELCDPDDELIDAFYAFEKEFHNQFLTTCGPVNSQITTTMLNNAAAMHEFTGVDPYNQQAQEKSHLFTFYSRYDANTFQDTMPDTGAAGVFTAGEPQVKALQKRFPKVTVDTSTAG